MTACSACLHYSECMERRGRCREYKDLKGVMEDIEMLNQTARATKRTNADKAKSSKRSAGTGSEASGGQARETARNRGEPQEAQNTVKGNHGISTEAVRDEAAAESGSDTALGKRDDRARNRGTHGAESRRYLRLHKGCT